jgi:hypothetical protein
VPTTTKSLQNVSVEIVDIAHLEDDLPNWTRQVYANTPYHDEQLSRAAATAESVVPSEVGVGSPLQHVLHRIQEIRTCEQVLDDAFRPRCAAGHFRTQGDT